MISEFKQSSPTDKDNDASDSAPPPPPTSVEMNQKKDSDKESNYITVQETVTLPSTVQTEVLSYLVHDYQDLAHLRLLSMYVNENLCSIANRAGYLKCCFNGHSKKCISELLQFEEDDYEGQTNDLSTSEYHLFNEQNEYLNLDSILAVVPYLDSNASKSVCNVRKDDDYYKSICHKLCETKSLAELKELGKDALQNGLFLPESTQSYDDSNEFGTREKYGHVYIYQMAILELSFMDGAEVGEDGDDVSLSLNSSIDVFNKEADIQVQKCDKNSTFRGFVKDGKVRVPICLNSKKFNDYDKCLDFLPMTDILNTHQYNMTLPEGVSIVDRAIPRDLHDDLMNQIDDLAKTQEVDYHPHSRDIVRDLVHPALYAYVKGISKVEPLNEVPPCKTAFEPKELHEPEYHMEYEDNPEEDYWGRPYEVSLKYQWLPTYFDIDTDGNCKICDYINNLAPRSAFTELYSSLEKLFTRALPQIESVYNYGLNMRTRLCIRLDGDMLETWISPFKLLGSNDEHYSLKGQRLQVITKIVDYELGPGETYEGVWHVEGMSHEEIVATAIYFLHRDDDINGGNILFKRGFDKDEAEYIFHNTGQCRHTMLDKIIDEGLVPLGQVETLANRLIVFPNSHVHKVRKIKNVAEAAVSDKQKISEKSTPEKIRMRCDESSIPQNDTNNTDEKQKRRIVVFFFVNPEKRIVSTREVKPQQQEAGGSMSREEACKHRIELMKERKYTKQDWNVREISLCEH